ncbi:MAG: hypothetical protein DMF89_03955 [Acidobacteria bacterium]|nr:MAG: hypothetical protein DMF89_03955 [Acidobacteriota bacterium]
MDERAPGSHAPFVTRAAVRLGHTLGSWRSRRLEAAQNRFVDAWKAAWTEGCEAAWQGIAVGAVPYRRGWRRKAWYAGWHWATTNPGRDGGVSVVSAPQRRDEEPRPGVRAVTGGAVGVSVVAAMRWLMRSRQKGHAIKTSQVD